LIIAIEGGVAAEEEVGDDTDCPDVDGLAMAGYTTSSVQEFHSFQRMLTLLEDLRSHVLPRRSAPKREERTI